MRGKIYRNRFLSTEKQANFKYASGHCNSVHLQYIKLFVHVIATLMKCNFEILGKQTFK